MEQVIASDLTQLIVGEVSEKKDSHAGVNFRMITFSLSGKDYAIDILKVKKIAKAERFTPVPNTAPYVAGVHNLRGAIIPIIDLRYFFNLPVTERAEGELESMIVVGFGDKIYGIVVDRVEGVFQIQKSAIQPPHPLFGDINIKYIRGIIENNNSLYILLDINRIFGISDPEEYSKNLVGDDPIKDSSSQQVATSNAPNPVKDNSQERPKMHEVLSNMAKQSALIQSESTNAESTQKVAPVGEVQEPAKTKIAENSPLNSKNQDTSDFKFLLDSLHTLKNFYMSSVNGDWVKNRFSQWVSERGDVNVQLMGQADANKFLAPFYSQSSFKFWTQEYADAIYALLPENDSKLIQVWNPGCAAGHEAFSLACLLKKRYPEARIKIYAQDNDLIAVSSATILQIPTADAEGWYKPYVMTTVAGDLVFIPEIRDSIFFEYHDCTNTNIIPDVFLIFAREFLSCIGEDALENILVDFYEKIKENGIVIIGDNEILPDRANWLEKTQGSVVTYMKQ